MEALFIGLSFLILGLACFFWFLFKYTKDAHKKELEDWQWVRDDKFFSWVEWDISLLHRIGSKSYILTKVILLFFALIPVVFGVFALWVFFSD
jgi:membrane protein required for beta-lactamase induction